MRRTVAVSTLRLIARAAYPLVRWRMVGQSRPEQNGSYVEDPLDSLRFATACRATPEERADLEARAERVAAALFGEA